jgi:hypothetical protein
VGGDTAAVETVQDVSETVAEEKPADPSSKEGPSAEESEAPAAE